jgi:hypothetical protein
MLMLRCSLMLCQSSFFYLRGEARFVSNICQQRLTCETSSKEPISLKALCSVGCGKAHLV